VPFALLAPPATVSEVVFAAQAVLATRPAIELSKTSFEWLSAMRTLLGNSNVRVIKILTNPSDGKIALEHMRAQSTLTISSLSSHGK
jgi:hypothetical protein